MRVLLCEDEKSLSKAIVTMLQYSGYEVDAAYDGEFALEKLKNNSYDVVVMDIMMPKKDGITLLKELRGMCNNVPVIMLTAKSEVDDKVVGLQSGANDYLTKPFAFKELVARIEVLTRNTSSTVLKYGNLSIDGSNFELKSNGGSLRLVGKEFEMLEMLINSSNGKIPTQRFMEKVWRNEKEVEDSIVCVYISYLQRKLQLLGSDVEIRKDIENGYYLEKV